MIKNSKCVILHTMKLSESSKIITTYSEEYGKLSLVAKGAFSNKSKFLGLLETSYIINSEFYFKENRELHTLSNAEIIHRYKNAKTDFRTLICQMICCELTNKTQNVGEINPELFNDLQESLIKIDIGSSLYNTLRYFLFVIKHLGYQISLSTINNENVYFNLNNGKINSVSGLKLLKNELFIFQNLINDSNETNDITLQEFNKIINILIRYTSLHIDKQLYINSLEILN